MDTWLIGLIAICALGLGAIVFGAVSDRRRNQARAAAILAPPQRDIPAFTPQQARPQYLSELMARRSPAGATLTLSATDRESIKAELARESTAQIDVGFASKDFITDPESGWAVLDSPRILVCAESPGSVRELITVLEKVALAGTALVIVAPRLGSDLLGTLEVNVIQGRVRLLVITSERPAVVDRIAADTGARLVSRIDLQASYLTDADLGHCARWVSAKSRSWIVAAD